MKSHLVIMRYTLTALFVLAGALYSHAEEPEFQVNTYSKGRQQTPSVAALDSGGYIVAWHSDRQDGGRGGGVYSQQYDLYGVKDGGERLVNIRTAGTQYAPSVAALKGGGYIVTWIDRELWIDGEIVGRIFFGTDNNPDSGEIPIVNISGYHSDQSVTPLTDGNILVTWTTTNLTKTDVYGQILTAGGDKFGDVFRLNTIQAGTQQSPVAVALGLGEFVVAWQDHELGTILGQRFFKDGSKNGKWFKIGGSVDIFGGTMSIAPVGSDRFVVVWKQNRILSAVRMRLFLEDGTPLTSEKVIDLESKSQGKPFVAPTAEDGYIVTWERSKPRGLTNKDIVAQHFTSAGDAVGARIPVNVHTKSSQTSPRVASGTDGHSLIVWESQGQDGSRSGIFGRLLVPIDLPLLTNFPLYGVNYRTAEVISVFDHSVIVGDSGKVFYACDGRVQSFTNAIGVQDQNTPPCSTHPGYKREDGSVFDMLPHINYTGVKGTGSKILNYDGHPAFDYRADHINVFSAASGVISYPRNIVGARGLANHILAITPDADQSYRLYYLHLSTYPDTSIVAFPNAPRAKCYFRPDGTEFVPTELPLPAGTRVASGCLIAISGEEGTCNADKTSCAPHLHFEVQRIFSAEGINADVRGNQFLWCYDEETNTLRDNSRICLPVDPYGWSGNSPKCSNKKIWGSFYACQTGIINKNLWVR